MSGHDSDETTFALTAAPSEDHDADDECLSSIRTPTSHHRKLLPAARAKKDRSLSKGPSRSNFPVPRGVCISSGSFERPIVSEEERVRAPIYLQEARETLRDAITHHNQKVQKRKRKLKGKARGGARALSFPTTTNIHQHPSLAEPGSNNVEMDVKMNEAEIDHIEQVGSDTLIDKNEGWTQGTAMEDVLYEH
ncbi:hypothetical protein SeLEV6574_g04854 [Synchytrium endobioticum]|nr:hypothetical protein SeLEV6574_g04854 [Synchytrium endobioticum]